MDIAGKAAVDMETATAFTKMEDKLFARLKTAIEPAIKVEAMAVVAMVFNCPAPRPRDLGAISCIVFTTPGSLKLKYGLYLNPEKNNDGSCTDKCRIPPNTTPHASPVIPILGTKNKMPVIMPILYIKGAKAVTKNLWNTCKTPEIIFEAPKIMGLKNIICIIATAASFLAPENPGAIAETIHGAANIKTRHTKTKNPKKTFKKTDMYLHADFSSFIKCELNIGMTAAPIAPKIRTEAIKSGTVKAV